MIFFSQIRKQQLYSMPLFSADSTIFSKKFKFCHWKHEKNTPSKVAHNWPNFFFTVLARLFIFHIINMSQDSSVSLSVTTMYAKKFVFLPICFREIKLEWPILISASPRVELCLPITTRSCLTKYSNSFPWIFAIAGGPLPRSDNGVLSLFFKDDPEAGEELVNRVSN